MRSPVGLLQTLISAQAEAIKAPVALANDASHIPEARRIVSAPLQFSSDVPLPMRALIERMCALSSDERPPVTEVCDMLAGIIPPAVLKDARELLGEPPASDYDTVDDIVRNVPMCVSPHRRRLLRNHKR